MEQKKEKAILNGVRAGLMVFLSAMTVLVNGCGTNSKEVSLEELLSQGQETITGETSILQETEEQSKNRTEETSQKTVWVHMCGEVEMPGIYELLQGSRVYDGVAAAGGFTAEADTTYYNLAALVSDGMKIRIPAKGEKQGESSLNGAISDAPTVEENTEAGLVNINTATSEQLQTLPGIGKSRAAEIIAYREENGGFKEITQIMEVSGIKEAVYEKIKDLITLD